MGETTPHATSRQSRTPDTSVVRAASPRHCPPQPTSVLVFSLITKRIEIYPTYFFLRVDRLLRLLTPTQKSVLTV
jgi:hypothetical protein